MLHRLTERFIYMPADGSVDRPILGAVLGDERTLYVDAGNSKRHAAAFREALRAQTDVRSPATALTHWHWDHVFGAAYERTELVAHRETRTALERLVGLDWSDEALDARVAAGTEIAFCAEYIKKEYGDGPRDVDIALPDATFDQRLALDLGGVSCVVEHVGGVHAADSCVMYVPEERVLFLGDALGPAIYDGPRYYDAADLLRLLDRIAGFRADWFIESHHVPVTAATFWAEMDEYRALAELTLTHGDDRERIEAEFAVRLGRALGDAETEAIEQFLVGERRRR